MLKDQVLEILMREDYYTQEDLRYNTKCGIMLSKSQLSEFLAMKKMLINEGCEFFTEIPLITFNSPNCFFTKGLYLLNSLTSYVNTVIEDYRHNSVFLIDRNFEEIMQSRVFSEIEGTLKIENVPTTRKRIGEIYRSAKLKNRNDIIIKNMINAILFILEEKPAFNKDNLFKLYKMLSDECLDEENKLLPNSYYRHEDVFVDVFSGAPADKIDAMLDSLFEFVNSADLNEYQILVPYIAHYYILYTHPYFDYNGRTARMVSFWLSYILDIPSPPFFISEAINEHKSEYYKAIKNSRIMDNDLTYFLGYVMETSTKFCMVYKNLEEIKTAMSKTGDFLTSSEAMYVKKILIHNPYDYFNYKIFLTYINGTISKQGALKILDRLSEYKLLIKSQNKKRENIYKFNQEFITYKFN